MFAWFFSSLASDVGHGSPIAVASECVEGAPSESARRACIKNADCCLRAASDESVEAAMTCLISSVETSMIHSPLDTCSARPLASIAKWVELSTLSHGEIGSRPSLVYASTAASKDAFSITSTGSPEVARAAARAVWSSPSKLWVESIASVKLPSSFSSSATPTKGE